MAIRSHRIPHDFHVAELQQEAVMQKRKPGQPHKGWKDSARMSQVLSGCAVRAVIQQELPAEERHYLGAILVRLRAYYEIAKAPNIREQLSDEIDWLEERLGVAE